VVLLAAIACSQGAGAPLPEVDSLPPPSDPAPLAGSWQGELTAGGSLRRALGLASGIPITVTIAPSIAAETTSTSCRGCAGGAFATDARGALSPTRRENHGVQAWLFAGDIAFLRLGGCCDSGELELYGRIEGDRMRGTWAQAFLTDGPHGTFELRRAPPTERAKPPHN